jgi:GNAT superfamily N-acetyltransferase
VISHTRESALADVVFEVTPDLLAFASGSKQRLPDRGGLSRIGRDFAAGYGGCVAALEARPISARESIPLRRRILRPHERSEDLARRDADGPPAVHAGVFDGEALIAVGRTAHEPHPTDPGRGDWRIRGMAVEPERRGTGAGTLLLRALLEQAEAAGGRRAWCIARTPAAAFYARAGFVAEGEEFVVPRLGPHVLMSRPLG